MLTSIVYHKSPKEIKEAVLEVTQEEYEKYKIGDYYRVEGSKEE